MILHGLMKTEIGKEMFGVGTFFDSLSSYLQFHLG
jgi:hypothetical protein